MILLGLGVCVSSSSKGVRVREHIVETAQIVCLYKWVGNWDGIVTGWLVGYFSSLRNISFVSPRINSIILASQKLFSLI